jgi:hypothetical protein
MPFTSSYAPANRYTEELSILCSETILPGSRFSTSENNQDYYGISQKFAYRKDFDTIDMTFYVDAGYRTLNFFEQWMDWIASPDENTYSVVGDRPESTNAYYRFKYPNRYKTTIYIHKFNKDYQSVFAGNGDGFVTGTGVPSEMVYTFVNAFPSNISSIPISYDQSQLLKTTVTFTYDRYFVNRSSTSAVQTDTAQQSQLQTTTPTSDKNAGATPFDSSKLGKVITNEYYNNGILGRNFNQRQGPGQRSQDATNFGRDIA